MEGSKLGTAQVILGQSENLDASFKTTGGPKGEDC